MSQLGACLDEYQRQKVIMAPGKGYLRTSLGLRIQSNSLHYFPPLLKFPGSLPKAVSAFVKSIRHWIHGMSVGVSGGVWLCLCKDAV